jgi:hypothetical protein
LVELYMPLRHAHIKFAFLSIALVAALVTVAFLVSVARAHHPLGLLAVRR